MSNIKKNFIYNISYQILILIIPFITTPYVARVLGADGVGTYSYTYSIAYYFMTFALLGINSYGNRLVAKVREDKDKLSKEFFSLYTLQIVTSAIMIILYYIYIIIFEQEYLQIAIIQSIYVWSAVFDINWFFQGLEKFKLIVVRNSFIKLISLIAIFMFVRTNGDLWKYVLILALGTLCSQLILYSFLRKNVKYTKIKFIDVKKHIKPVLVLFIPVVAITFYKVMAKIMLGNLSTITEVGYYENAEKVINVPISIITAIGTVMLPSISNLISKGEEEKVEEYLYKMTKFMYFLVIPMALGIILISDNFVNLYLGSEFSKSSIVLKILSISMIFSSTANVLRTQYLIPKEKDKGYVISVIMGAIVNFIFNMIFINYWHAMGAAIATLLAEATVTIAQLIYVRKQVKLNLMLTSSIKYIIVGIIMFAICMLYNLISIQSILKLLLQIATGIIIYMGILFITKDEFIIEIINKIKEIIFSKLGAKERG
jgi:O-antigen/teichoic acid export membrane protein